MTDEIDLYVWVNAWRTKHSMDGIFRRSDSCQVGKLERLETAQKRRSTAVSTKHQTRNYPCGELRFAIPALARPICINNYLRKLSTWVGGRGDDWHFRLALETVAPSFKTDQSHWSFSDPVWARWDSVPRSNTIWLKRIVLWFWMFPLTFVKYLSRGERDPFDIQDRRAKLLISTFCKHATSFGYGPTKTEKWYICFLLHYILISCNDEAATDHISFTYEGRVHDLVH